MLEDRISRRKAALTAAYSNTLHNNFLGGLQGANAFALDIGLGDERTYRNLVKYYETLGRFDTGIFGTEIVSRVLFERGNADLAVKLLTSDNLASFEGMRRNGSTTIWEYWPQEGIYRSYNHPMFGAVVAHLFDYLLGIGQEKGIVGYEKIVIRPQLTEKLNRVSGSRAVPAGVVSVSYEKKASEVEWVIVIPENLETVFDFGGEKRLLAAGENRFVTAI
jgi:alpha-L-rhamnosidase